MNLLLEFYNKIGGVLDPKMKNDVDLHLFRRARLYDMLGIPSRFFNGANVLDIGSGSGYNALAFLLFGAKVHMVEPNQQAQKKAVELFASFNIQQDQFAIYSDVEDIKNENKYDLICAEAVLHVLEIPLRNLIMDKIKALSKKDTLVVIGTMCEFSYFYEDIRRYLGKILVANECDFKKQVALLSEAFGSHLKELKYAVRPIEDWVIDNILNPANELERLDLLKIIDRFGGYEVRHISPELVPNLSWYKDMDYCHTNIVKEEFSSVRHLLLDARFKYSIRSKIKNQELAQQLSDFQNLVCQNYETEERSCGDGHYKVLKNILNDHKDLGSDFVDALSEVVSLLEKNNVNIHSVSTAKYFKKAWGRGLYYVCLRKM
ncbi:methyltransferase domain-containing protein [Helicobacter sp.]|uniref:class I SAM-dependent methyltransferase n=1 Tax=Helicobacter sp. TaxID=218 RepID=UPI002585C484|nr:methyltransferase domain-containing protein [Helicobacter sp.]MCI7047286.1 class I SAM-dependent methyltransferase [Helicobacter sp.]